MGLSYKLISDSFLILYWKKFSLEEIFAVSRKMGVIREIKFPRKIIQWAIRENKFSRKNIFVIRRIKILYFFFSFQLYIKTLDLCNINTRLSIPSPFCLYLVCDIINQHFRFPPISVPPYVINSRKSINLNKKETLVTENWRHFQEEK